MPTSHYNLQILLAIIKTLNVRHVRMKYQYKEREILQENQSIISYINIANTYRSDGIFVYLLIMMYILHNFLNIIYLFIMFILDYFYSDEKFLNKRIAERTILLNYLKI